MKGIVYDSNGKFKKEINLEKSEDKKEYKDGILIFEGKYLYGERKGKGKQYDKNGKLIFEGEYYKGRKLEGKSYVKGKLEYEGEFLFNKKWNGKDMINMEILFMN